MATNDQKLTSNDEVIQYLESKLTNKNIIDQVKKIVHQVEEDTNDLNSFFQWIKQKNHLKVSSYQVSSDIIPQAFS